MNKEWFIWIEGKREGPYSVEQLKRNPLVTLDTLVWKSGFTKWKRIRDVPELKELFEEKKPTKKQDTLYEPPKLPDDDVLALQFTPPQFTFWFLLVVVVLIYLIYRLV